MKLFAKTIPVATVLFLTFGAWPALAANRGIGQSSPVTSDSGGAILLKQVRPEYPAVAKRCRIQGSVSFSARVNKDGTIQSLSQDSGSPILAKAAKAAVNQWVFQPAVQEGEAVEVIRLIRVTFRLE